MMINRMPYKSQSMNLVHKSKHGGELWLGDYFAASNISLLKQKQIKSVLTAAAMLGIAYAKDHQINHKTINAFDLPSFKMTPHFEEAYKFIDDALKKGNVLVHCAAGISRSTTFVLVYLMKGENMTFKQALDYVRSKRSIVCPNQGFQRELKRYELTLKRLPPADKEKVQEKMTHSEQLQEKQTVLDFLKDQKKEENKLNPKMNATVGGGPVNRNFVISQPKEFKGLYRGTSLNYSKKPASNLLHQAGNKLNKPVSNLKDPSTETSKLAKQFLTFKLQTPKIVTIKK